MKTAIGQAQGAREARDTLASYQWSPEQSPSTEWFAVLEQEFQASLVAVTASALALDALYGAAIGEQLRRQGPTRRRRVGKILEALKDVFETGPVNQQWADEFNWLFARRDAAVHPEEKPKPSARHPLGMNLSPEYAEYSVESAERAVVFALSVLRRCVDFPRRGNQKAAAWALRARSRVDELERLHAKGRSSP